MVPSFTAPHAAVLSLLLLPLVLALPKPGPPPPATPVQDRAATAPTVVLAPANTVVGAVSGGVEQFGGIYYADPPTGDLRLRPPQRLSRDLGDAFDASGPAAACPQMLVSTGDDQALWSEVVGDLLSSVFVQDVTGQTEDCLTVSVARPVGTKAGDNLPVLFWIFGGAFEVSHVLHPVFFFWSFFFFFGWGKEKRKPPFVTSERQKIY